MVPRRNKKNYSTTCGEKKSFFFCYFVFVSLRERMGGWRKVCIKNLRLRRNVQISKETGRGPKNSVFYEPPTFLYKFVKGKMKFFISHLLLRINSQKEKLSFLLATYFFLEIRERENSALHYPPTFLYKFVKGKIHFFRHLLFFGEIRKRENSVFY